MPRARPSPERVYFVGAGLSAGMGYPTGRDLVRDLLRYLRGEPPPESLARKGFRSSVHGDRASRSRAPALVRVMEQVLERYFNFVADRAEEIPLAEFFTVAQTLAGSTWLRPAGAPPTLVSQRFDEPSEATLFADLAAATRSYFQDISDCRARPSRDVQSVLERLRPGADVVVNFNWDDELDSALDRRSFEYTEPAAAAEGSVLMLKPHGSVGWYDVMQGIGNAHAYFIADGDGRVPRPERRLVSYWNAELPKDIDRKRHPALACPPVLTPPTFAKRFDYVEQEWIWKDVISACAQAHEFVFLGYAMPADDLLTRAAIRSALRGNLRRDGLRCVVVDCAFDDGKRANFESVFGRLDPGRHFLEARLGSDAPGFAGKLERALRGAKVT